MKKVIFTISLLAATTFCTAQDSTQTINLSIDSCRAMAMSYNAEIRKSENSIKMSQYDNETAKAGMLPTLDATATVGWMKDNEMEGMGTLLMRGFYMAGFQLTQPLYTGGQIYNGVKMSAIGKECNTELQRKSKAEAIASADNAYYTLYAVKEKIKMINAVQDQLNSIKKKVETSIDQQLATNSDLLMVKTKLSELEYNLQKTRNGEELCRMALCQEIGVPFDTEIILTDTVFEIEQQEHLSEDISKLPEIALLEKQIEIEKLQVVQERSALLPMVALSLGISWYGNIKMQGVTQLEDGSLYDYENKIKGSMPMAMLSVQVPLFHYGDIKKVKKQKLAVANAEIDYENNQRLLTIQARQAVQNLNNSYILVKTAELGKLNAEENLRVIKLKFDNQLCTMTDFLEVQGQLEQAKANLIEAQTQYKINQTEYLRVTGNLN